MSTEGTHQHEAQRKRPSEETAKPRAMAPVETAVALPTGLLDDLRSLIEDARGRVAAAVNVETVMLNWHLGQRIWREILGGARAGYGKQIVDALSRQLIAEYGRGFGRDNLFHMVRFARTYPEEETVDALSRQLSWTHLRTLMYVGDPLKREFYTEMCRVERWNTRTLKDKIGSMLYQRSALSKKPEKAIKEELARLRVEDRMTPDMVFRDPVVLRQLGLAESYSEKELEGAILREIQAFLQEMGTDFAFLTRQKQMVIDGEDHWLDLLFYHRRLRCLFGIELKIGRFKAGYKGQMELYLRWLEENEAREGEAPPLGLILCAGKSSEQIRLLQLDRGRIRVAEYMTELPPREVLEDRLHRAIEAARERLAAEEPRALPNPALSREETMEKDDE